VFMYVLSMSHPLLCLPLPSRLNLPTPHSSVHTGLSLWGLSAWVPIHYDLSCFFFFPSHILGPPVLSFLYPPGVLNVGSCVHFN
jgi:hypothetical protein